MGNAEEYTERILISNLRNGNERAFKKLFDKYRNPIYAYSLSVLKYKPQAEEIVQEVFLKVWLNQDKLDPTLNFKSYVFTIARNLAFNVLAKAANDQKLKERIFYKSQSKENRTEAKLLEADYARLKDQAIEELTPRCRMVFHMSRNEGKSYEEIAHELGISKNTVKNQMSNSLAIIKEFLRVNGDIVFIFIFLAENFIR